MGGVVEEWGGGSGAQRFVCQKMAKTLPLANFTPPPNELWVWGGGGGEGVQEGGYYGCQPYIPGASPGGGCLRGANMWGSP